MGLPQLKTLALALGGLVHGFDFQETSGTALTDFSASALNGTLGARGALNGASVLTGAARSVTGSGNTGTGAAVSRAVAGGSPLQLSTAFTVVEVLQLTALPSVACGIAERNNNWSMRLTTGGLVQGYVWVGGVPVAGLSRAALTTGATHVVAMRFDGTQMDQFINAARDGAIVAPGTVTATTDALDFQSSSRTITGQYQAHMLFNRALDDGEIRELTRTADTGLDRLGGVFFDNVADGVPVVAAAPNTLYCGVTGGRMRSNEPLVIPGGSGRVRQPVMRRVELGGSAPITSSSTQADYGRRCLQHATDVLLRLGTRGNTSTGIYHDGTKWRGPVADPTYSANWLTGSSANYDGAGVLAAIMARYILGGSHGPNGVLSPDPLIALARASVQRILAAADPATGYVGDEFTGSPLGELLVALDGLIPKSEHDSYVEQFLQSTEIYYTGGSVTGGTLGQQYNYYINGNREGGKHLLFVAARNLSGTATWATRVENHFTFWTNPPTDALGTPNPTDPVGVGFGLRLPVVPVNADGSDGKGYLTENHGGARGFWNIGNTAEHDGTFETVNVDGFDTGYTDLALKFTGRIWLVDGNVRYLRIYNLLRNKLRDVTNTTTWVEAGAYSSRHTSDFPWAQPIDQILTFKGGRVGLSTSEMASQWNTMEVSNRNSVVNNAPGFYRALGYDLGNLLMSLSDWPG